MPVFHDVLPSERLARLRVGEADITANVTVTAEEARLLLLTRSDIALASLVRHCILRAADLAGHAVAGTTPAGIRLWVYEARADLAAATEQGVVEAVVLRRPVMTRFLTDLPGLGLTRRFILTRRLMSVGRRFGAHDLLRALDSLIFLARTRGRLAALSEVLVATPQPDPLSF